MELNKKTLEEVRFKTKGKWYDGRQVDAFIDEIIASLDELEYPDYAPEESEAPERIDSAEIELAAARAAMSGDEMKLRDLRAEIERLTAQKDELTRNISLLKSFKEQFKASVGKDIDEIKEKLDSFTSDALL